LADAESEVEAVKMVRNGITDPDIAMKYLGLRYKDRWSRLQKHEHTGPAGGPIGVVTTEMTQKEATQLYQDKLKRNKE